MPETEAERSARRYSEGAWANSPHGSASRYNKGGCRCEHCRTEANRRKREQYARRRAAGGQSQPGTIACVCRTCGTEFKSRKARSYCSRECYRNAVGTAPEHDWYISRGWRLFIYDRDGWRCQLCGDPVDMTADTHAPTAPTLDHITPRSRGGSDDPKNLRLAHRGCNARRQSAVDEYVPSQS
ncbi:HNH endonuclease [Microbacterium esteraromaticum]|uniref:HNH endonuclease n=1 Tax=Microbacterium esteraromaticum TaxID=57043 RepID=UPI003CC7D8E0